MKRRRSSESWRRPLYRPGRFLRHNPVPSGNMRYLLEAAGDDSGTAASGRCLSSRPLTPLQQRFIDLSAKKAHLLNPEQLQQAVNDLSEEVEGLNAWSKLDEGASRSPRRCGKLRRPKPAEAAKVALRIIDQIPSADRAQCPEPWAGSVGSAAGGQSPPDNDSNRSGGRKSEIAFTRNPPV